MEGRISRLVFWLSFYAVAFVFEAVAQSGGLHPNQSFATNDSGIPILLGPNGRFLPGGMRFTTKAYERAAFKSLLAEANRVARELDLRENPYITESNLSRSFIVGYGMSLMPPKMIGNIHTKEFGYFVSVGHKLSYVEGAHQDEDCLKWMKEYRWPKSRMDTNGAYQLATQWLAAARIDVASLNRDCEVQVEPERFANRGVGSGKFVPIYFVYWQSAQNRAKSYGSTASVKLFAPTKTLMSLRVEESDYILRPPLVFTNLAALLSDATE